MPYILKADFTQRPNGEAAAELPSNIRFMSSEQAKEYCRAAFANGEYLGVYLVEKDDDNFCQLKSLLADAKIAGCFHKTIESVKLHSPDVWQRFERQQEDADEEDFDESNLPDLSEL